MSRFKTIRARLLGVTLLLAFVTIAIGVFGISRVRRLNDNIIYLRDISTRRMVQGKDRELSVAKYIGYQKMALLAANDKELNEVLALRKAERDNIVSIIGIAKASAPPERLSAVYEMESNFQQVFDRDDAVIDLYRHGKKDEARNGAGSLKSGTIERQLQKTAANMSATTQQDVKKTADETVNTYGATVAWMTGCIIVGVVFCLGLSWWVVNGIIKSLALVNERIREVAEGDGDLTKRLEHKRDDELGVLAENFNHFMDKLHGIISQVTASTEHIAAASEEISSSATQVAHSTDQQREQSGQVATAMNEMSMTVMQVSDNAQHAAGRAKESGDLARDGGKIAEESVEGVQALASAVRDTAQKIERLGQSSHKIGKIVSVIDDIADQTNLLALNAAIEAARAGEQGRGFAVVADEVRKLAERTTQATKEIAQMISVMQDETQDAVDSMNSNTGTIEASGESSKRVGEAMAKIIKSAQATIDATTQIATAAAQQSGATEQVNKNMEQIATMVQHSALGAQESAKACQDLSNLAVDLQHLVGRFKIASEKPTASHHIEHTRTAPQLLASQSQVPKSMGLIQ